MSINSPGLNRSQFNSTLKRRFAAKCAKPDSNGCIQWLGVKTRGGYGMLRVNSDPNNSNTTAHRIAWVLERGDLSPEILVLHRCDNPSCVAVDHLFIGYPAANTHDMMAKGRHGWRERTPWQKLDFADGKKIRKLRDAGHTQQYIADEFKVSRALISMILAGKIQHSLPKKVSRRLPSRTIC